MGVGREGVQILCLWHMFMIELLRAACIFLFSFCLNVTGGGHEMGLQCVEVGRKGV